MQDIILKDHVHRAERIDAHTWNICEADLANCYLLEGDEHALLIDLGCGAGNLRRCAAQLTKKTLTTAVTHRHPDHVGACGEFGFYYAGRRDCTRLYDMMCAPLFRRKMIPENLSFHASAAKAAEVIPMDEGMVFDLGGRTVRTESIPGHTRGSMMFIDDDSRMIFTGDDVNPCLWMHLPGCTTLKEWLSGAHKVQGYLEKGYRAFYGHGDGIQTLEQVNRTIHLAEEIVSAAALGKKPKEGCWPDEESEIRILYSPKRIL